MSVNGNVYTRQGDQALVVAAAGKIVIAAGGGIVPASSEAKAAAITNFASSANMSAAQITKLNALLAACRNVGILATS